MSSDDDTDTRVRPIPEEPDLDAIRPSTDRGVTVPALTRGRGLATLAGVMAVALLVLAGWGALGERDPGSSTDAGSDSPHVGDDGSLVLAARLDSDGWVIDWTPRPGSQPTGAIGAIPSPTTQVAEAPTIDRSGEWLASPECDGSTCDLSITLSEDRTLRVTSLTARDHLWHSDVAARIAWIDDADVAPVLRTGFIDSDIEFRRDRLRIEVASATELHRWDEHGFVVSTGSDTQALDSDGRPAWTTDGIPLDATSSVVVVEHRDGSWSILDRTDGTVVAAGSVSKPEVRLSTGRTGDVVSTTVGAQTRHTFRVEDPTVVETQTVGFTVVRLGSVMGTDLRLLRDETGNRFTMHVTSPDATNRSSTDVPDDS